MIGTIVLEKSSEDFIIRTSCICGGAISGFYLFGTSGTLTC